MKCNGRAVSTGERIEVEFDSVIQHVDPLLAPEDGEATWLAPGFVDLQVNGFAGVDYNSPAAAHEEIARSIRAIFSTGVTRFFPTVITGSPDGMAGALRNLAGDLCIQQRAPLSCRGGASGQRRVLRTLCLRGTGR